MRKLLITENQSMFLKRNIVKQKLNENLSDLMQDAYENISAYDLFWEFLDNQKEGIKVKQWELIPAQQYYNLLQRYMSMGDFARIPDNPVRNWMKLVIRNSVTLEVLTLIAGHGAYFPIDDFLDVFRDYNGSDDFSSVSAFLESIGFYDWCKLPDGSKAISDYGLTPIFSILNEYHDNQTTPEETLILINRCLDVYHQRGDLSSCFIQGGWKTCSKISNGEPLNESIIEANYQMPDKIEFGNQRLHWTDEDAMPFFVMSDGSVEWGSPRRRHVDFMDKKYNSAFARRDFVDDIILQGRYWKNSKFVSFWYIDWDYYSQQYIIKLINKVVGTFGHSILDCKLAYKDHIYTIEKDGDRLYFKTIENTKTKTQLSPEAFQAIDKMFEYQMFYYTSHYCVMERIGQQIKARPLNYYESLAGGCHQFIKDAHEFQTKYTKDDLRTYISQKYNLSFDELIDYYESVLRNRTKFGQADDNDVFSTLSNGFQDEIVKLANECGIGDTEILIRPLEDGNPYSFNVRTIKKDNAAKLCQLAKQKGFIVDRVLSRLIDPDDDTVVYSFRIRKNK